MVTFGTVMLGIALISSVVTITALLWGKFGGGASASKFGYYGTYASAGALTLSIVVMLVAFFSDNFTFLYVAQNHSPDVSSLRWLYTLSGLWAGREGSFLLWAWFLSLFAAWIAHRRISLLDGLSNMGLMVTNVVLMLFTAGMMFSEPNNPFKVTPADVLSGGKLTGEAAAWGMNPLLQHWAMILHPPTLFIGYAGMTIPFAFAIAAIIENDSSKAWVEIVDRMTVFAWLFLGAGIGLGSVWAYVVLGWGGYWGWDPVENASLLPWLTGVGLLHSFTIYRKRGGFKRWAVMLASFSFALVILGTFITRSGIVQSVHAFEADPVSLYLFLGMIVGSIGVAVGGLAVRWQTFAGNDEFESLTGKEAAYYFNNVIMSVAGWLVAYLTVTSALPTWLLFGGRSIPATTFDSVARPVGILYLAILAVCPILSWRATDGKVFWSRIKWPALGALGLFALLMIDYMSTLRPIYQKMVALTTTPAQKMIGAGPSWYYNGLGILGLFVAALLISNTIALFITSARNRAKAREESFFYALGQIIVKSRSQSGGYLAHIGMGIILIGLIGSAMFVFDNTYTIKDQAGQTFQADTYDFVYQSGDNRTLANGNQVDTIKLAVSKGGKTIGVITPGQTTFPNTQQTRTDASVLSQPLRDVFVTLQSADQQGNLAINVKINPLIWFSWGGFIILLIGTGIATYPSRKQEVVVAQTSSKAPATAPSKGTKR